MDYSPLVFKEACGMSHHRKGTLRLDGVEGPWQPWYLTQVSPPIVITEQGHSISGFLGRVALTRSQGYVLSSGVTVCVLCSSAMPCLTDSCQKTIEPSIYFLLLLSPPLLTEKGLHRHPPEADNWWLARSLGLVSVRLKACAPLVLKFCCVLDNPPNQWGDSTVLDFILSWTSYLSGHCAGEGHLLLLVPFPLPDAVTWDTAKWHKLVLTSWVSRLLGKDHDAHEPHTVCLCARNLRESFCGKDRGKDSLNTSAASSFPHWWSCTTKNR